jgi:hypothetical protein
MKKILILSIAMLCTKFSIGQYVAGTAPETFYGNMIPGTCSFNDVGSDTRSAGGASIFGYGSNYYANYMNVTVNSCNDPALGGTPGFYWDASWMGNMGSSPLPAGALDPDVILVSPATSNAVWAIAVYYLPGAYCMSTASFNPGTGTFNPMSGPMPIQAYTAGGGNPPAHINIDSDNAGHFGVVLQMNGHIRSYSSTVGAAPLIPLNMRIDLNLIEPDIAFLSNSIHNMNIIGLRNSRNRFETFTRTYTGALRYSNYLSPNHASLYEPRIAAPSAGLENDYSITVLSKYAFGASANFDVLYQTNEAPIRVANDGTTIPAPINYDNSNEFPALTYAYQGVGVGERVVMGWWVAALAATGALPNQPNTFIGVDVDIAGTVVSDPNYYMDISNVNGLNNTSTIAVSGRYSDWAKNAAFTYEDPFFPGFAFSLMWKWQNTGAPTWKIASTSTVEMAEIKFFPNPATDQAYISLEGASGTFSYEVYSQVGRLIDSGALASNKSELSVSDWASGVYLVTVKNEETSDTKMIRFVKQ